MRWIIALLLICMPVFAEANELQATKVISGDDFILSDGREIRLAGIKAPTDESREKLQTLIADHTPVIENAVIDRYERTSAHIYIQPKSGDKIWLQGELLRAGLAFVYTPNASESRLDNMLKIESEARQAKRGLWSEAAYADILADKAKYHIGHFGFVSGKVLKAERIKNKIYLRFGDDWREDFTIAIVAHDLHTFRKAGIDPLTYEGKTIRVRGWIKRDFGPVVTVTGPEEIQILSLN